MPACGLTLPPVTFNCLFIKIMATYILFWNPDISSYTKERFLGDFSAGDNVGNWSFYEHDDVRAEDVFYMVRCGEGKTGIVMRGEITSACYHDSDWSPKNRRNIYYADIFPYCTINPWSDAPMLTPEILTEAIPDFNWFGGHSGRRVSDAMASKLDELFYAYLDENPSMFCRGDAIYTYSLEEELPDEIQEKMLARSEGSCEVCGYSYRKIFGNAVNDAYFPRITPLILQSPALKRLFYNICPNCYQVPARILAAKLLNK